MTEADLSELESLAKRILEIRKRAGRAVDASAVPAVRKPPRPEALAREAARRRRKGSR